MRFYVHEMAHAAGSESSVRPGRTVRGSVGAPNESHQLPHGTVTFLFTDIAGSTQLVRHLGEAYAEVIAEHQRLMGDVVARHGGRVVDTQGDAFFVAFARARDAAAAAAEAQQAHAEHPWPEGARVSVRMGLHSGEPTIADNRYVGLAVHRAARIAAQAAGGRILLSTATRELLEEALPPGLELRDLGEHALKDFDRVERIFELVEEGAETADEPAEVERGLELRILGPLEAIAGGRALDLGGPKPRALLAVLLVHAGEVVSTDRLIDELWGELAPKSAHHLLHVYVSRLRKALGAVGEVLVSRPPGYALEIAAEQLDARRFERLLGEGRRLLAAEDPEAAAERLHEALALWRGPALADFAYEPLAQAEIARLEELNAVALEERIEADLALGRHQGLVGELERLVSAHPLRERPRAQLMLALYRCGRQAEALEAFQEARRVLVDGLGIEPGPALQRLQQAILRHDAALELQPLRPPAPPRDRVAPPERTERKLVSVLASSVVDTPELDGLDPEARLGVVAIRLETVAESAVRHGATVETIAGESVVAVFGVPVAHEDDALRAVRAAWEAREALAAGDAGAEEGLPSAFGIDTGEIVVRSGETTGGAVARALRLSRAGEPGEILLGDATYRLARHAVLADDSSPVASGASGLAGCRRLLAVLAEAPTIARRLDSPLVGREHELAQLRLAFERVSRDRAVRLALVLGAAGVGKSRLLRELLTSLEDATALVGRCLSYGEGITYWPLREIVLQAAGDGSRDALLGVLEDDEERHVVADHLTTVLGAAGAEASREEVFWAVRRLLEAHARRGPLVVVLEDVHWAEPTLLDLIEYVADWMRDAPVLLVCAARPELYEERPGWPTGRPNATVVALEPLAESESRELIANLVSGSPLPDEARDRIVTAAEGNPLFLEQLLAMLAEEGFTADAIELPATIRAVLAARLDRLGPAERAVLEVAAVAGLEFWPEAVASLLPVGARTSVQRHLQLLVRKELVRPGPSSLPGREAVRFGHVLIQDVAYRAVAKERRTELHERLAGWFEDELGDDVDAYEAIVGYHLERAFRYREELQAIDVHARRLAERGAARLASAGRRALQQFDPRSAASLLGRAAGLLEERDPRRLELLPELVEALREAPDPERAAAVAADAVWCAEALADARSEALARIERAHVGLLLGRAGAVEEAFAEAERARAMLERLDDDLGLAKAWRLVAMANRMLGRQSARREALERAHEHVRRTGDRRTEAWIWDGLGGVHNYGPASVADLLRYAEGSLDWARANGQRFNEVHALAQGFGRANAMLGDFDAARRAIAEANAMAEDLGFVWHRAGVASAAGFVERLAGDLEAAERELRAGYELVERSGMTGSYFGMALRDELADVLCALGRYEEARELSALSEELATPDDVQAQVQWRSLKARLLARDDFPEEAEELARAAVALVERTEFLIVHANAVLDLGEVLALAGKPDEAAAAVAEAVDLFEAKGDRTSAARAAGILDGLTAEGAAR
jgi:class 3 adenylate cyclase/tetratricopeptide (TPR) repeat protein